MSDPNKPVNRIPFETIGAVSAWRLPSLDDARTIPTAQREAAQRQKPGETVEDVSHAPVKPLTADELQKIAAQAEQEGREHGYQQGYERGHQEGRRLGLETGQKKAYEEHSSVLQEQTARFKAICDALMEPLASQDKLLENTLVEMSIQIARHLINQSINENPAIIFNVVEKAIESLPVGTENIQVFLHPDDLKLIQEHFPPAQIHWSLREDSRLQRGGCKLASQRSLVDYSIEHRLQQYLEQVREQGEPDPDEITAVEDYRAAGGGGSGAVSGSIEGAPEPALREQADTTQTTHDFTEENSAPAATTAQDQAREPAESAFNTAHESRPDPDEAPSTHGPHQNHD